MMDDESIYQRVGLAVRTARQEMCMSQRAVAHALGWGEQKMSRIECGHARPDLVTMAEIASVLQLDVGALIEDQKIVFVDMVNDA